MKTFKEYVETSSIKKVVTRGLITYEWMTSNKRKANLECRKVGEIWQIDLMVDDNYSPVMNKRKADTKTTMEVFRTAIRALELFIEEYKPPKMVMYPLATKLESMYTKLAQRLAHAYGYSVRTRSKMIKLTKE